MRTTLSIDESLLKRAKKQATAQGVTLGRHVEDAVRTKLAQPENPHTAPSIPIFTRGDGLRPGIDPSSTRALYDALDAEDESA